MATPSSLAGTNLIAVLEASDWVRARERLQRVVLRHADHAKRITIRKDRIYGKNEIQRYLKTAGITPEKFAETFKQMRD